MMQNKNIRLPNSISVIFILVSAFFVRAYNLRILPLNHDESTWTIGSLEHFDKFMGIPAACFRGYIQPFFSCLVFISKTFFSLPEYIVRIPAVIIGTLTVIMIYILAKEMFGRTTGLISGLLLCFLPWHVIQSRIGVSLILVPFFGCLIFYTLFRSLERQSKAMFILSSLFLGIGSFYTYQTAPLFVVIFVAVLLFLRKEFTWLKTKTILISISIFLIVLFPLIYLEITDKINFLSSFYRAYHHNPFQGNICTNLFENFKNNSLVAWKALFFASHGMILYGAALERPLLLNIISLVIVICSLFTLFNRRNASDKIILGWLCLGFLGGLAGVNHFQPRYIIIVLIPLLIVIGRGLAKIFDYSHKDTLVRSRLIFSVGLFLCGVLFFMELQQLRNYYCTAPTNLEECRRNSYGCKEAAKYLSNIQGLEDYRIITDARMTVFSYLRHVYLADQNYAKDAEEDDNYKKTTYYVVWAPESHPEEYWDGKFSHSYTSFITRYPQEIPLKTIYYPDGLEAIHIFKVVERKQIYIEESFLYHEKI